MIAKQQIRRLYYISDVHLEMRPDKWGKKPLIIPQPFDENVDGTNFLALCGDIGCPFHPNYRGFLDVHSKLFKHIFVTAGNHEYYTSDKHQYTKREMDEKILQVVSSFDNITYIQSTAFDIDDDFTVIGCTLWTEVNEECQYSMNDYNRIYMDDETNTTSPLYSRASVLKVLRRRLRYMDVLQQHGLDYEWLENQIKGTVSRKLIVMTHHAPSMKMLRDEPHVGYGTDCEILFRDPVYCWISGHTHECKDIEINGIRSLSNCFGYPSQKTEYKACCIEF